MIAGRARAWRERRPALALAATAALIYVVSYPLWTRLASSYNHGLTLAYSALVPVIEHPRLTDSIEWLEREPGEDKAQRHVASKAVRGGGFTFGVTYLFGMDIAILLALTLATPAVPWAARARIALLGAGILAVVHLAALALTLRETYARAPMLDPALQPAGLSLQIGASIRSVLMSEITLAAAVLLWAGLGLREWRRFQRDELGPASDRTTRPARRRRRRAAAIKIG